MALEDLAMLGGVAPLAEEGAEVDHEATRARVLHRDVAKDPPLVVLVLADLARPVLTGGRRVDGHGPSSSRNSPPSPTRRKPAATNACSEAALSERTTAVSRDGAPSV